MANTRDPEGPYREVQPGGRSSRGPNADPGGAVEPGGLIPPYEGRTEGRAVSESSQALTETIQRQSGEVKAGHGQTASPAQESPARPDEVTNETPESPHGVGESTTRRAEDMAERDGKEAGRTDTGSDEGMADRPTGTSNERDLTGI